MKKGDLTLGMVITSQMLTKTVYYTLIIYYLIT